jgi:hypothetical protein
MDTLITKDMKTNDEQQTIPNISMIHPFKTKNAIDIFLPFFNIYFAIELYNILSLNDHNSLSMIFEQ